MESSLKDTSAHFALNMLKGKRNEKTFWKKAGLEEEIEKRILISTVNRT